MLEDPAFALWILGAKQGSGSSGSPEEQILRQGGDKQFLSMLWVVECTPKNTGVLIAAHSQ